MAFNIKDAEADRLVRDLARHTGETLTEVIVVSVRERLARVQSSPSPRLAEDIERIAKRCASRPVRDARSAEEILGYDGRGLPN